MGDLGDAGDGRRRRDAEDLEEGRGRCRWRARTGAATVAGRDARRPVDDERVGDAALVDLALPAAERGVAGHRPAPRVVVVAVGSADLVDVLECLLHRPGRAVPRP